MPSTHIGIVTYNSTQDLTRCLPAIQAQTYPNWTLTVFDNASTDGSLSLVREAVPAARIIENRRNWGFGRAHNAILSTLKFEPGDYYLPLNPDVILTPTYIAQLVEFLADSEAGWATGKLIIPSDDDSSAAILYSAGHTVLRSGYAINIGHGLVDGEAFSQPREVFGAPGAAPLYKQALIDDLIATYGEFFDEQMFMYSEDVDIDWRARHLGWRCWFVPAAVAYHAKSDLALSLRVHGLANRYLSVIKNAFFIDLILYNLPIMMGHLCFRLLVTPRAGLALIRQIVVNVPGAIRKRRRSRISRSVMLEWFRWSASQPTAQPRSLRERFDFFTNKENL